MRRTAVRRRATPAAVVPIPARPDSRRRRASQADGSIAGVRTIAVRSGGWGDDKLRDAVAIYADAAELNDRFDDSPLGNG